MAKKYLAMMLIFLIPNIGMSFYTQEQLEQYQQTFQFGTQQQIAKILDNLKFNLEKGQIQIEVIDLLKTLFTESNDPVLLQPAVFIVGEKEINELSPYLIKIAKEVKEEQTLSDTLRTLGKLKNQEILPYIKDYLSDDYSDTIKQQAIFVLGQLKDSRYNSQLISLLESSQNNILVEEILKSMAEIKDPSFYMPLEQLFNTSPSNSLKAKAALAIAQINSPDADSWLKNQLSIESDPTIQIHMLKGYLKKENNIDAFLKEYNQALKSTNDDIRKVAIEMIPETHYKDAIPFLEYTIKNDLKVEIKQQASETYIKLDTPKAIHFFIDNIEKGSNYTQVAIIEAIKKEKEKMQDLLRSLFSPLYRSTTNPYIQGSLVTIASDHIDIKEAQTFLAQDILANNAKDKNTKAYQNQALKVLTIKDYQSMLPRLQEILNNPDNPLNTPLFNNALRIITYNKKDAKEQYTLMLKDLYTKPYTTLQRSDFYNQLQALKPDGIKDLLMKNYVKETDPQTKFQINRILKLYGVNNLDTKTQYRKYF